MIALLSGLLYFAVLFVAGFVLGTIRVLWLAPLVGARSAELIEMPFMLAVMIAAAFAITRRMALAPLAALGMGIVALALMLLAEFALVLPLRGLTIGEYFRTLDPLTATVYYAMLALFAVLPLLLRRMRPL